MVEDEVNSDKQPENETEGLDNISDEIEITEEEELVVDEMADELAELPLIDDSEVALDSSDDNQEQAEEGLSSTLKFAIGNGIILSIILLAILLWRRNKANKINPGDLL
ncbi:MAG: hypothetical protein Q9N32_02460 [Gammaproteobacteria bacterium]|nr:hypothetical protein [Gammaproteobacteria bacterium]